MPYFLILHPEIASLQKQLQAAAQRLSQSISDLDHLLLVENLNIEVQYQLAFGKLQNDLYHTKVQMLKARRKLSLIRAAISRNEAVDEEGLEKKLQQELEEYEKHLEQMKKKYDWAVRFDKEAVPLSEKESKVLKQLYHKLVKKLHPDLNEKADPNLLEKAMLAYQNGDLEGLEELALLLEHLHKSPLKCLYSFYELEEKLTYIKERLQQIQIQKEKAKASLPYTLKQYLETPQKEIHQKALEALFESYLQQKDYYERQLEKLHPRTVLH